jgi:NNP family nitrate/nitrite transporter-like MFS transporter
VEIDHRLPLDRENKSNVIPKKSTGAEPASVAQPNEAAAPFWLHLGPVFFFVLIFFINFIGRMILSPLLPTIEKELAISHGQAGLFFFLMSAGYLVGLLGSGFFASHSNHKITIVVSSAGVGVALLGISFSSGLWTIRAGLFGLGFAAGLYIPSAIAAITALVDRPRWGKAIAIHELAPNLAFFTAPFVAEAFLKWSSWRMALSFFGVSSLIVSIAYYRFGRGGEFRGESPASSAFGMLVRTPAFWLMLVLFGLGVSTTIGVYAMLPLYLVSERHIDQSWANTLVALSRSYGPILGLLGGMVSDRLGPKQTIVISLTFTGIITVLLGRVSNNWISTVVLFQPLLAVWFFPAAFAAIALITPPGARNLAVAFTVPFGYIIGGGAIPTFIGMMGDAGLFAIGFLVTGLVILCGGALALLLRLPE